jgi:hypothetical protein
MQKHRSRTGRTECCRHLLADDSGFSDPRDNGSPGTLAQQFDGFAEASIQVIRKRKQSISFVADDLASFAELFEMVERDGLFQRDRTHGRLPCLAELLTCLIILSEAFVATGNRCQDDNYD